MSDLKNGSKGEDVSTLQQALNKTGDTLKIDGIFGHLTEAAVKRFQAANNLTVDGIVGEHTAAALKKSTSTGPRAA